MMMSLTKARLFTQVLGNLTGSTTLDRKRIYANPSSYPNPKVQLCFRTNEMTSFFDQV